MFRAAKMQPREQFDTGVDAGRKETAPERVEPGRPGRLRVRSRTARSLAAVLLAAFAVLLALPFQAEAQTTGICGRTEQVQTAILDKISGVTDCANVTDTHLAAIGGRLDMSTKGITALATGDFDGLTALEWLRLQKNSLTEPTRRRVRAADRADAAVAARHSLTTLPDDIFEPLTALTLLRLSNNSLTTLPDDVFDELTALTRLDMDRNLLATLPDNVFDELTELTDLFLYNNHLTALPNDVFDELTKLDGLYLAGNRLTALPAGVFDELTKLTTLGVERNQLTALPDDVFEPLTALTRLWLQDNPGAPFSPHRGGPARWRNGSFRGRGGARRQRQRWRAVGRECLLFLGADRSGERGEGDVRR